MQLKYVHRYVSRGREFAYYRRGGQRIPIRAELDTPEFLEAYAAIHRTFETPQTAGSFAALIKAYKTSPDFKTRAPRTRKDYDRILGIIEGILGDKSVTAFERKHGYQLRDKFADTPRTANYIIEVLRMILGFAVARGWRRDNPLLRWDGKLKAGPGWRAWTDDEIAAWIKHSRPHMRLVLLFALHTGQRQADCLGASWRDVAGTKIRVRQNKTGVELVIPMHKDLRAALATTKKTSVRILTTPNGQGWEVENFRKAFREARNKAGLTEVTFHGLRKTAARKLAEVGCTEREIMAITGHKTTAMVSHYVRDASQEKLADAAILKLERKTNDEQKSG